METSKNGRRSTMRNIKEIIVHCSATIEGKNFDVNDIDYWHQKKGFRKQKGSGMYCGYHYVILLDGTIQKGRLEEEQGAHCLMHNVQSIGICYIGGLDKDKKPKDTRTEEQKESMMNLINELKGRYKGVKVYGHRDFANRNCPCFDAGKEYNNE